MPCRNHQILLTVMAVLFCGLEKKAAGQDQALGAAGGEGKRSPNEVMILFGSLITYEISPKGEKIAVFVYRDPSGQVIAGGAAQTARPKVSKKKGEPILPRAKKVILDQIILKWLLPRDGTPAPAGVGTGLMGAILQSNGDTIRGMLDDEWHSTQEQTSLANLGDFIRNSFGVLDDNLPRPHKRSAVLRVDRGGTCGTGGCQGTMDQVWDNDSGEIVGLLCPSSVPDASMGDAGDLAIQPADALEP